MERDAFKRRVEIAKARAFMIFCSTCQKDIYDATADNVITRSVALLASQSHCRSFSQPHDLKKVYIDTRKDYSGSQFIPTEKFH